MIKIDRATLSKTGFQAPSTWLATWFGTGFLRPGPGTWGSLAGLPFGLLLLYYGGIATLIAGIVFIFITGLWAARTFALKTGETDSSAIVIDEVAGLWLALLFTPLSPVPVIAAFVLFRLFDIFKPWPVSWAEKILPGPWGVMADDVCAGLCAGICAWTLIGVLPA